uniref:USP domain-containing protein n=1 Tax=Paramormyrops kingsleyae TaxID=1676925 RepID=A0A3B3SSR8_9TELE
FSEDEMNNMTVTELKTKIAQKLAFMAYYGLQNLRATCYLNAVLQTLFMTKQFREAVERWESDSANLSSWSTINKIKFRSYFYLKLEIVKDGGA